MAIWAERGFTWLPMCRFFATKGRPSHGLLACDRGRHSAGDPRAHDTDGKPSLHALRFVARRLGLRRRDVGIVVTTIGRDHHGATRWREGLRRDHRSHCTREWERQTGLRRPELVLRRLGDLLESVPAPPSDLRDGVMR